jgi:hypothetical protein
MPEQQHKPENLVSLDVESTAHWITYREKDSKAWYIWIIITTKSEGGQSFVPCYFRVPKVNDNIATPCPSFCSLAVLECALKSVTLPALNPYILD